MHGEDDDESHIVDPSNYSFGDRFDRCGADVPDPKLLVAVMSE